MMQLILIMEGLSFAYLFSLSVFHGGWVLRISVLMYRWLGMVKLKEEMATMYVI